MVVHEGTDATVRELMVAMVVSFYNDHIIFVIILLYLFWKNYTFYSKDILLIHLKISLESGACVLQIENVIMYHD